jgi:hypothetical protein
MRTVRNKGALSCVTAYDSFRPGLSCGVIPADIPVASARRITMAKGQLRGNKEAKKPKKPKQLVVPVGSFIAPPKTGKPIKVPH